MMFDRSRIEGIDISCIILEEHMSLKVIHVVVRMIVVVWLQCRLVHRISEHWLSEIVILAPWIRVEIIVIQQGLNRYKSTERRSVI